MEEYADQVGKLNENLNFVNKIGKEKEREYVYLAREVGIEQGLEQAVQKNRNARALIRAGFDKDKVFKTLELNKEEIAVLNQKST